MGILDWSFIVFFSIGILSFIFGIVCIIVMINNEKQQSQLKRKKIKNKAKRKRINRAIKKLKLKKKKYLIRAVALFFFSGLFCSGAFFSRWYQQGTLDVDDSDRIVQIYYLIPEIKKQVQYVKDSEKTVKSVNTLRELTRPLASQGTGSADIRLSDEGQSLLNRYYAKVQELAANVSNQTVDTWQKEEVREEYLSDIQRIEEMQQEIFEVFKIKESDLKKAP